MVSRPRTGDTPAAGLAPWSLANHTPFAADRAFFRDPDGAARFVVAVRGVFAVGPDGLARPSAEREPVRLAPEYAGEPGRSELLSDTDLVPEKPTTDVLVRGRAHAPGGTPVRRMRVELRLPGVIKQLTVTGEERFARDERDPLPRRPAPFAAVPVTWSRALGGGRWGSGPVDELMPQNPVGRGAFPAPGELKPQIFPADGDARRAAGFGPLDRFWEPRRSLAGAPEAGRHGHADPRTATAGNPAFHLCSPADQRPARHLRGGEAVSVLGMTPAGHWGVRVPEVQLDIVARLRGRPVALEPLMHTLLLEPDAGRVQVVWQASLSCPDGAQHLGVTTIHGLEVLP